MRLFFQVAGALGAAAMLTSCTGSNRAESGVPTRDVSSRSASSLDALRGPAVSRYGAELESGVPIVVTDGNRHIMYPASAQVVRSDRGLAVTVAGHTTVYSPNAQVVQSGSYHHYARIAH